MRAETILVVDDEKLIRWAAREELGAEGFTVLAAENVATALEMIERHEPDLVLLDQLLEDGTGLGVLEKIHADYAHVSVIMITAIDRSDIAVRAMKLGAADYITKPLNYEELKIIIERTLDITKLERRFKALLQEKEKKEGFCGITGASPVMRQVFATIKGAARASDSTVLIIGESGTGKELAAKAIHCLSDRSEKPMMTVNCGAISEQLMESELFGHEKGSFTDARSRRKGVFELGDDGTVFLDEIGDLPERLQAAILRVLEQRTFRRLGGETDISVNVRFLAATNQSLESLVQQGKFRQDLYYRLNVLSIEMPSLRSRGEDILLLAQFFINEFNRKFRKQIKGLTEETKEMFLRYNWPGNVRELRNIVERAMLMVEGEYLFSHGVELGQLKKLQHAEPQDPAGEQFLKGSLDDIERAAILNALEMADHNQSQAARLLKISRDTLRYRMKKFGLS
ncbi:MAG: DNA-binding response regulator [Ignavibacteria bacterium]|nr:MAG: DNA-binding response regulator [Ignavibacteria bacterium]